MAQNSNTASRRQGQDLYPGLLDFQVQIRTYCTVEAPWSVLPVGSVWRAGYWQWWDIVPALGNIQRHRYDQNTQGQTKYRCAQVLLRA